MSTTPATDRTVADAIDRVLEAEHAATLAVAVAEAAARTDIDAAREMRRAILETARQRVMRLHERAQRRLAARLTQLDTDASTETLDAAALQAVATDALAAVAERLTTDTSA
jgi:vacuolar-type H+-ATPase subunit H